MPPIPDTFTALVDLSTPFTPPLTAGWSEARALQWSKDLAEIARRVNACTAVAAADLAHRSRPELGYDGLAARLGVSNPAKLVQTVTGVSNRDAVALVKVGTMITALDTPRAEDTGPVWLRDVATAVKAGRLSVEAAQAISAGLGKPTDGVTVQQLTDAATELLRLASSLTVEKLGVRARQYRNDLDSEGVAGREAALRDKRFLNVKLLPDGMTRLTGLLDPESAAVVTAVYNAAIAPRRGVRFVDPDRQTTTDEIARDERTTEQIALDTLVTVIKAGTTVDKDVLPVRRAEVQVLVAEKDYRTRTGYGLIQGQTEAVSMQTVERTICDTGILPILFSDEGQPLNLGRTQRLFTPKQKQAIAARDGGCIGPDCDRPIAYCEVHHILQWLRDHGYTDVADGVLLCSFHHLWVHNNGWTIKREGGDYFFVPPPDIDSRQRRIPARAPNPLLQRLTG
jgi:hypothetical protein